MRTKPAMTILLGTTLAVLSPAADALDEAVIGRLRDLNVKMLTGTGRPANAPKPDDPKARKPTAHELLEWHGLLYVATEIEKNESKAEEIINGISRRVSEMDAQFNKLNTAAGSKDVAKGTAGIGKQGLGWYCSRANEMIPYLDSVAGQVKQQATGYAARIGQVPLGKGRESTLQLTQYANDFERVMQVILKDPKTEAMIKDLNVVAEGIAPSKAFDRAENAGEWAKSAATEVRKSALRLQDIGVELVPLVRLYVDTRRELGQEIAALKPLVEHPQRRAQLNDLEFKLRNSRKSSRSADEWGKLIRKEVDEKHGMAQARMEAIQKLQAPVSGELQACKDMDDLQKKFARARLDAHDTITSSQSAVESAYNARAALIDRENKLLDEAIRKFEKTETEAAQKAKIVFGQLQVIDRKTPEWREKELQYDRLEKMRKDARNNIETIRRQRNEYAEEQNTAARDLAKALSSMRGTGI